MSIIFFDIDGTVMDLDGTIPPSAVTAVRRLRQAGHHLSLIHSSDGPGLYL